ncbi:hypothetical protein [Motilimonas sp. E26]|uniref:lipopolysaccharide biosynthesis protein n=1 Tax=Motilimonas sp. E26 TaxID=2865674 RepID=UPI001E2AA228|nr:hypothetical protein [Motilimonas sp. E26]MCE0555610.1 hypothetical protein [Motilimonas sp. E26]
MAVMKRLKIDNLGAYLTTGGGVAAAQLISFASVPLIARLSGPDVFGEYTYYFSLLTVLCVFCTLKLEFSVFNIEDKQIEILEKIFNRYLLISSSITAVGLLFIYGSNELSWWVTTLVFFLSLYSMCCFEFRVQKNIRFGNFMNNAKARVSRAAIFPILFLALYYFGYVSFTSIFASFACANLLSDILFMRNTNVQSQEDNVVNKKSIQQLWPKVRRTVLYLTPAHFLRGYTSGAIILLSGLLISDNAAQIGMYAIAIKFLIAPANIITSATSDVIKREVLVNPIAALKNFKRISIFTCLIGIAISVVVVFFSGYLSSFFLGDEWLPVSDYAIALLPNFLAILILSPLTHSYLVLGRQDIDFYWQISNSVAITIGVFFSINFGFLFAVQVYSIISMIMMIVSFCICYRLIKNSKAIAC